MGMSLDFSAVLQRWHLIVSGTWLTVELAALSALSGFLLGTLCAVGRRSSIGPLRSLCATYVELIRNTPFLVQIFLVYFGLSSVGFPLSAFNVAVVALTINTGAYAAEIMRAGFDSVKKGQWEAAECLGMSRLQAYWHVAFRPGLERVYPSLTSQFVLLMLSSSVTSQISVEELTAVANFVQLETYRPFETYILIGLIYVALSLSMRAIFFGIGQIIFPRRRKLGTNL